MIVVGGFTYEGELPGEPELPEEELPELPDEPEPDEPDEAESEGGEAS